MTIRYRSGGAALPDPGEEQGGGTGPGEQSTVEEPLGFLLGLDLSPEHSAFCYLWHVPESRRTGWTAQQRQEQDHAEADPVYRQVRINVAVRAMKAAMRRSDGRQATADDHGHVQEPA